MLDKVEFLKKGFLLRKYRQYMWYFPSDKQMHWAGDSLRWGQIEKIWFLGNICLKDLAAGVQAQQQMKGIKMIFCQHSNNIDKLLETVRTYEKEPGNAWYMKILGEYDTLSCFCYNQTSQSSSTAARNWMLWCGKD